MYKKVFLILCSVILLGVLLSCAPDDYDDGRDDAPPEPYYKYGKIILNNNTSSPITEIKLRRSGESDWGINKLISETGLQPGDQWKIELRIPDVSNSIYVDLKVATAEYSAELPEILINEDDTVDLYATMQPDEPEPLKIFYVP